jgi:hypothetical protein
MLFAIPPLPGSYGFRRFFRHRKELTPAKNPIEAIINK